MELTRRQFLKTTGAILVGASAPGAVSAGAVSGSVALVVDPTDPIANAAPAQWAIAQLRESLTRQGVQVRNVARLGDAAGAARGILAAGGEQSTASEMLRRAGLAWPTGPESLVLHEGHVGSVRTLLACGHDTRALVYALLELADRVQQGINPLEALTQRRSLSESPANEVRSN